MDCCAGRVLLGPEAGSFCADLGGTLAEPLSVSCFTRRGDAEVHGASSTAPVLEYQPAHGKPPTFLDVHARQLLSRDANVTRMQHHLHAGT